MVLDKLFNSKKKELKISSREINSEELKSFLSANKDIKSIDLFFCKLHQGCMKVITDFLRENDTIESLHLKNCEIKAEGIIQLSDAISYNSSLKYVSIASNPGVYEVEAVKALKIAIKSNKSIVLIEHYDHGTDCQFLSHTLIFPQLGSELIQISNYWDEILEEVSVNQKIAIAVQNSELVEQSYDM